MTDIEYDSHKFSSPLAEYLHGLSLESLQDDTLGSVQELGWYAQFDLTEDDNPATMYPEMVLYAILEEDSRGFVGVETFNTRFEMMREWTRMQKIYDDYWAESNQDEVTAMVDHWSANHD